VAVSDRRKKVGEREGVVKDGIEERGRK